MSKPKVRRHAADKRPAVRDQDRGIHAPVRQRIALTLSGIERGETQKGPPLTVHLPTGFEEMRSHPVPTLQPLLPLVDGPTSIGIVVPGVRGVARPIRGRARSIVSHRRRRRSRSPRGEHGLPRSAAVGRPPRTRGASPNTGKKVPRDIGEPDPLVARVQERMPVMLMADDYDRQLDPSSSIEEARSWLELYDENLMKTYAVSRLVNSVKNDVEACIEPVEGSEAQSSVLL